MKTSFRLHLAALAIGLTVPTTAFALEAGIREAPAKEIAVPTADVVDNSVDESDPGH